MWFPRRILTIPESIAEYIIVNDKKNIANVSIYLVLLYN